jgi:hypothetical protein
MTGKQILAENKLFLTAHFNYSSKSIVLRVYFKRDDSSVADIVKVHSYKNNRALS